MMKSCFYNTKNCSGKLSKEHVVSKTVLKEGFGDKIRNLTSCSSFGGKMMQDLEATVRDVCTKCNSSLSPYDIAGRKLLNQLITNQNDILELNINNNTLNWIIKTHFNFFRVIKDEETKEPYQVKQKIKINLVKGKKVPTDMYSLYIQEWEDNGDYWNAESANKIQFMNYKSIRFIKQNIVMSNFRLRNLDTLLFIPTNKDYKNFNKRIESCIEEIKQDFGITSLQHVDTSTISSNSIITVKSKFIIEEIEKIKYKVN